MATLAELIAMKNALEKARFTGTLTVRSGDDIVTYKSDAEMKAALADLTRLINSASGAAPVRIIYPSTSKGL